MLAEREKNSGAALLLHHRWLRHQMSCATTRLSLFPLPRGLMAATLGDRLRQNKLKEN